MESIFAALERGQQIGFDVTDPRKSFSGYTVYRLVLKIHVDGRSSPIYEFLAWKRYNDFKRLHKELKSTFSTIIQDAALPEFAKPKLFGRFDEQVIEDRRKSAIQLLMFAASHPSILKHQCFTNFIQCQERPGASHESARSNSESSTPPSSPQRSGVIECLEENGSNSTTANDLACSPSSFSDSDSFILPSENVNQSRTDSSESGHDWLQRVRSACSDGEDIETLASEASENSTVTCEQILSSSPKRSLQCYVEDGVDSALDILSDSVRKCSLSNGDSFSDYQDSITDSMQHSITDKTISTADTDKSADFIDNSAVSLEDDELCALPKLNQMKPNSSSQNFQIDDKMAKVIEKTVEEDDYIHQASQFMENALEQETVGNHNHAFNLYKLGIGILLRGVQTDNDTKRREAVRRKTAQYVLRAETLYNTHLQCNEGEVSSSMLTINNNITPTHDSKWRFRLSDVRVFGVIDKVMLVQNVYSNTVYVMKVLHKVGAEYSRHAQMRDKQKRKPRNLFNCRFMVLLRNCVETTTGVYLLLEYIEGGLLWNYLGLPVVDPHSRKHSCASEYHSLDNTEHNSSFSLSGQKHFVADDEEIDVVDIPALDYTDQGDHDLCSSFPRSESVSSHTSLSPKSRRHSSKSSSLKRSVSWSFQSDWINEEDAVRWLSQIAVGLMELHVKGIICRDLNPRNILIDAAGNVKLTYFSKVDGIDYELDESAVQSLYTAPEIDSVFDVTESADWWSFGVVMFELLTSQSLYSCHPGGIHPNSVISIPRRISNEACGLLGGLLRYHPKERLGSGHTGDEEIKSHPFFRNVNWEELCKNGR